MTREEAKEVFLNRGFIDGIYDGNKWREACIVISKWLEQEPCEDAISRQEVLYLIADDDLSMGQVVKGIHALPSVTPQPRKGHWIFDGDCLICSKCKKAYTFSGSNFCPDCGAEMKVSESEE